MSSTLLAPLAALLYLAATASQLLHISQYRSQHRSKHKGERKLSAGKPVIALGLIALVLHALIVWHVLFVDEGVQLGFFKVSALIFFVINLACLTSLLRRPLQNLLVILFPLSAISVLVSYFAPETGPAVAGMNGGLLLHVTSSILAYAVLTLAAVQAAVLAIQDHNLRHGRMHGMVRILPPLQQMEDMLFELLWIGLSLLTIAIASGAVFVDDLFAQSLVHKTALTIAAWLMFSTLLWAHYRLGWRSMTAVRFTLGGFILLMLAFFGSKLVLELILQR